MSSSRFPRALRRFAAAAAIGMAASPALEMEHRGTVRHAECEHGRAVHVGALAAAPGQAGHAPGDGVRARVPHGDRHGHDHCILAATSRDRRGVAADQVRHAPPARGAVQAPAVPDVGTARVAVLRLAPKQSPPA